MALPSLLLWASQNFSQMQQKIQTHPFSWYLPSTDTHREGGSGPDTSSYPNSEIICNLAILVYASQGGQPATGRRGGGRWRAWGVVCCGAQGVSPFGPASRRNGDDRVRKVGDVIQKGRPWAAGWWDVGRMRRNSCPVALAGMSRAWGPKSQGLHVKLYIYNGKERSSHIYNGKERGGGREWWGQRREFRSTVCSVSIFCLSDLGSISK